MLRRQLRRATGALHDLSPYLGNSRRLLAPLVVLSAVAGFAQALALVIVASIAVALTEGGGVAVNAAGIDLEVPLSTALGVAGASVALIVGLQLLAARLAATLGTAALTNASLSLFGAFLGAGWAVQSQERRGRLQDLLSTHLRKVASGVSHVTQLLIALSNLAVFITAALILDPLTALAVVVGIGLLTVLLRPVTMLARRRAALHAKANAELMTTLTERVSQAREIKVYDAAEAVMAEVTALQTAMATQQRALGFIARSVQVLYQGVALAVVVIGLAVVNAVSLGDLASLGAMVLLLLRSISYGQQAQTSLHGLGEMRPYLDEVRSTQEAFRKHQVIAGSRPVERIGTLRLDGVGYDYGADGPALEDLSLTIEPGEMVGIVGPSGSGKSTLVQVLLRLREPSRGTFLVDEVPAGDLDLSGWYQRVAFVPQDPQLVDGTVADNIRFFRDGIDDEAVEHAARLAHLHDEITSWPDGYATHLSGHASGISGGQAQRLCIARALAVAPELLVLDEPTSALDLRSESLIQETLEDLAGTTTMAIIAHRITTIRRCDRIAVLEDGRLAAYDRPEVLAADEGFFRRALDLSTSSADDLPSRSVS